MTVLLSFLLGFKGLMAQNLVTTEVRDSIVVTGEREVQSGLIDAPVKVEVLNEEYFEQQQYQDLAEGINDIAGVSTQESSRRAGSQSALIQGFGENSVLVMIDGTPVSQNSSFGVDLSQISTSDIKKVEVIKGGASALYGSQAMGGVINIVTKRPTKKTKASLQVSSLQPTGTSEGTIANFQGNAQGSVFGIGAKMSLSVRDQESLDLDKNSLIKDDVDYSKIHGSLYFEKDFGPTKVFGQYIGLFGKTISESSRPISSSSFGVSRNVTDSTSSNIRLGIEREFENGNLRALVNREITKDELALNDNPNTPYTETIKTTDFEAKRFDLLYRDLKVAGQNLTFGTLVKEDEVSQETINEAVAGTVVRTLDIDQKKIRSYEAFVQDSFFIGSFEVAPGARYQYDDNFGSYLSPKINISHYYDYKDTSFKTWATVGTGYRAPSVKERFFTLDHTSVANYIVQGNEGLEPEESLSFQLGEEVRYRQSSLYVNFFLNRVTNLINTVEVETNTSTRIFSYENVEEVYSRGLELGLKSRFSERLSGLLNFSYTETVDSETDLLIANRPLYQAMGSLSYSFLPKWNSILQARYTGSQYSDNENLRTSPSSTNVDLKLNYDWNKNLRIFSSINNIFDNAREPSQDIVVPNADFRSARGREVFIGLKASIL